MTLQFAIDPADRSKISEHDRTLIIQGSNYRFFSALRFGDFTLGGEVKPEASTAAALLVRGWPREGSLDETSYEIALWSLDGRPPLPGSVSGHQLRPVTKADDSAAAEAFRASSGWQPIEVECIDRRLRVILGGRLVTEADVPDESGGRIGIAVTRGVLELRNLRVRRLDRYRAPSPLKSLFPDVEDVDSPGLVRPTVDNSPRPNYSPGAMRRKVQGVMWMEAIIGVDGSISRVRVVRTLDDELDIMGVNAVRRWHFKPAQRDGRPVACLVEIQLSFTLR